MGGVNLVGEFGFYGKIPALGDFVTRSLPREQVGVVDEWMQEGLFALRSISENWLDSYLVAPVWQFVLPTGIWAAAPLCGLLMPSVDRVGRYFPLFACAPLAAMTNGDAGTPWRRMSRLAQDLPRVLHEQLDAETSLQLVQDPAQNLAEDWRGIISLADFNPAGSRSIWWSERTHYMPLREYQHRGRPDTELFLRLFGH
ncbi:MAG TPA: type VI secretion system-associated protein TagF [Tahibacter sp.]|uniref:type VI secretion system-associated protein TagF n=1 Tax=Tahibacter sp. TaxID=2056211 RepID=UPI002B689954|nr:type VI secretion system-associated protein TagF [Tahibacter sp.]HSX61358.1 type VI secretion system-associated protein TagF [Tahibacter sp.]